METNLIVWSKLTNLPESRRACNEVVALSPAVYVSTLDEDGGPSTRAMFNLRRQAQFPGLVPRRVRGWLGGRSFDAVLEAGA